MQESSSLDDLVAAVGSFLARLDEDAVSTLVAGLADCADLDPLNVSTANTLVACLERVHRRAAVVARDVTVSIVRLAVCAVAGAALVESEPVRHRAGDLTTLLQSAHRANGLHRAFLQISTKFSKICAPYSESLTSG